MLYHADYKAVSFKRSNGRTHSRRIKKNTAAAAVHTSQRSSIPLGDLDPLRKADVFPIYCSIYPMFSDTYGPAHKHI